VLSPPPPPPPNIPPTASFTVTCSELTCSFDPSGSSDSDGGVTRFDWDFGDHAGTGANNTNPQDNIAHHTYAQSGTYTVTLTIRDDDGATATATKEVTVAGAPPPPNTSPIARFTYSCSALTCNFNGGASSDPDGTIAAYAWYFGDGSGEGGNAATTIQHTYFQPGTYTAGLTVTDDRGGSNTQWQLITLKPNAAPTAAFMVSCTGLRCSVDGSGSSDTDGTIASYAWSFGDGSTAAGRTPSHDYVKAGAYTITLTVADNSGATASTAKRINPISLSARGYKQGNQQKVDLTWNSAAGTSYDLYRDGGKIATVQTGAYTDAAPRGTGTHIYRVWASGISTVSNDASVTF
jgi:PKD repeat protein